MKKKKKTVTKALWEIYSHKHLFEKQDEVPFFSIFLLAYIAWKCCGGQTKNRAKQEVLDKRVAGPLSVGVTNSSCVAANTGVTAGGGIKDLLWSPVSHDQLTNCYCLQREACRGAEEEKQRRFWLTALLRDLVLHPSFPIVCCVCLMSTRAITGSVQIRTIFYLVSHTRQTKKMCEKQLNRISYFWCMEILLLVCSMALCCTFLKNILMARKKQKEMKKKHVLSQSL